MSLLYEYGKIKLPRGSGLVYPVKKSEVDHALEMANVSELKEFYFSDGYRDRDLVVFRAMLMGESQKGYWAKQSPLFCVYAVPVAQAEEIRVLLREGNYLLRLAEWVKGLEDAPNVIRDVDRVRFVCYGSGELFVKDENGRRVALP
ncbi:hypothetical protein GM415_06390 [Pseudodesulfovibrio cashew]|uniref:Uncharacterized protein n=1 Tax=Pseudodesulfovibrio cashew TaxID=2678688 RepID=A0A6I6JGX6_9BACT|nr:hypothetical protein [Pseudodesulfovibrio cashew]QGY39763.1 hypothetical protein GM415_06390 [Pseudodesulfovibrio cashew]